MENDHEMLNDDNIARTALRIRALCKSYGDGSERLRVLNAVNLDAFFGEVLLLAGPSGCGKTTLLTLIAGLLQPDAGHINLFGRALEKMNEDEKSTFRRDHVGFVFQQFNLIPTLTARENAAVPLLIREVPRKIALQQSEHMLEQVGLAHRTKALPSKLSGGEQQRVAIARALISSPKMLICDEPTAALDGDTGAKIMSFIRAAAGDSNCCVIVVTHDSRIFPFGDRVARMADGKIASVKEQCVPALLPVAQVDVA